MQEGTDQLCQEVIGLVIARMCMVICIGDQQIWGCIVIDTQCMVLSIRWCMERMVFRWSIILPS